MTELERALVALGRGLDVPELPDFAPRVLAALERGEPPRATRRLALAFALALVALLGAVLAIPEARSALLRVLQIGGERIEQVEELPEVTPDPAELDLEVALGERVSPAEARRRAGFTLLELDDEPDRVYLGARGTVWFLYGAPDRVRLLVAQTPRAAIDQGFVFEKLAGSGTSVEEVRVNGARGVFLSGEPHLVALVDEFGVPLRETARLAQDVLVWERNRVAIRLEGDFTRDEAVELAGLLR